MKPLISVVLCTYNRSHLLENVIQDLCSQTLDSSAYEVIVVDNNSTDDTCAVVKQQLTKFAHLRYCFEPNQGISHARNHGINAALGDYIAYTDDDCRVPSDWLAIAKQIIQNQAPAVFGGPYFAIYDRPKPDWFKDEYGSHEQGDRPRIMGHLEYLDGGNIFFRAAVLKLMGGFNTGLGMQGQKRWYGEEVALVRKIRATQPTAEIYYDPALKVQHLVAPQKLSLRWHIRQRFTDGRSWLITFDKARPKPVMLLKLPLLMGLSLVRVSLIVWCITVGIGLRDRQQYPYWQNFFYETVLKHIGGLGLAYEMLYQLVH